jgi:hypothetical protein
MWAGKSSSSGVWHGDLRRNWLIDYFGREVVSRGFDCKCYVLSPKAELNPVAKEFELIMHFYLATVRNKPKERAQLSAH